MDHTTAALHRTPRPVIILGKYDPLRAPLPEQRASTPSPFVHDTNIWGNLDLINAIQIPKPRYGQDRTYEAQGDATPMPDPEAKGATSAGSSSGKVSATNDEEGDDSEAEGQEADAAETGNETTDTNESQVVRADKEASRARKRKASPGNWKAQAALVQYHVMLALEQISRPDTYRGPNRYAPLKEKGTKTLQAFLDKVAPNPMPIRPARPALTWAQLYMTSRRLEDK